MPDRSLGGMLRLLVYLRPCPFLLMLERDCCLDASAMKRGPAHVQNQYRSPRTRHRTTAAVPSFAVGTRVTSRPPPRSVRAAFPHTAPTSGLDGKQSTVCVPAPVTREPGTESRACLASPHSPRSLPFAPPTPRRIAPLCSPASQLAMARSDFSCPCIIGFGSSPSRCGPSYSRNI